MILAGSGERKSAVYSLIMQPFLDYEKAEKMNHEGELNKYKTKKLIWDKKQKIILNNFTKKIKTEQNSELEEIVLEKHQSSEPTPPKKMKLIYADTTPEALQKGLYCNIPFAGLMSDEANVFFAGRAKNNLGFLNQVWDGASFDVERRSSESFSVDGKLTMLLMIQPDLFMQYFKRHGKIASGSGFLSRFLISTVKSTQGERQTFQSSGTIKELNSFYDRINVLLRRLRAQINSPQPPITLSLTPSAQSQFQNFQSQIEKVIVRYKNEAIIAWLSKAPENLLRIAALFSYFENNNVTEVSEDMILRAWGLMIYYADQTEFLFSETLSTPEQDAEFLYGWLVKKANSGAGWKLNKPDVQRHISRTRLRNKKNLDAALKVLEQQGEIYISRVQNPNGSVSEMICRDEK